MTRRASAFDTVLRQGRVIDPETGFDAVADIGILSGRIEAVGPIAPRAGHKEINLSGQIVCPGFIDLHAHGQTLASDRMQAFDGVTTALELEVGVLPVSDWYDRQAQAGRLLNHGAAVSWIFARKAAMAGILPDPALHPMEMMGQDAEDAGGWSSGTAGAESVTEILDRLREGLSAGAIGIGIPHGYAPGGGVQEMVEVCRLAAAANVPTFTHIPWMSNLDPQSSAESYLRLIGYAAATGAHMHVCHLNSTSLQDIHRCREMLLRAQAAGLPISVEAYPYGSGSTVLAASFFAETGFTARTGTGYDSIRLIQDQHRIADRQELLERRTETPAALVSWHYLDPEGSPAEREMLDLSVLYPDGAIASDGMPWVTSEGAIYRGSVWPLPEDLSAHPRSAGTFARFLSQYCFQEGRIDLREALAKCTTIPADLLEGCVPAMRRKARIQPGCDADIIAFWPDRLRDRSSFENMTAWSQGISTVLVNGTPVIGNGTLDTTVRPGQGLRSA